MITEHLPLLCASLAVVAFLYASVGHAGASGYIAVLTLFGFAPGVIKPVALLLNVLVATLAAWHFWRAGYFSWRLFWPFALFAAPFAFLGGYLNLPAHIFRTLVALVLIYSACRFLVRSDEAEKIRPVATPIAVSLGAGIGLLSGLTGTGGGIFLSPLLLFMRWATMKSAAAVSALFILINSAAGLLGNLSSAKSFPALALPVVGAVMIGGAAGAFFGSQIARPATIRRMLAGVLAVASYKLLMS